MNSSRITDLDLAAGNRAFLSAVSCLMATDQDFDETLRRAARERKQASYATLQRHEPSLGHLYVGHPEADGILALFHDDPCLLKRFRGAVLHDMVHDRRYVRQDDCSVLEVPFDRESGGFTIGVHIIGYSLLAPPYDRIDNPYALQEGTGLERHANLTYAELL